MKCFDHAKRGAVGITGFILLVIDISMRGWQFAPTNLFGIGILVFSLYILFNRYQWGREYDYRDDE